LNGATGAVVWSKYVRGEVFSCVSLSDFSGDSIVEIAYGSAQSLVGTRSGANGDPFWFYPFENPGNVKKLVLLNDFTRDGVREVVAISASGIVSGLSGNGVLETAAHNLNWTLYR
jgi:hypothetical protein